MNDNEKKVMKDETLENRQYFFGCPSGTYNEVLEAFTGTKVNSCETSSLPLVEFWQPGNLGRIEALLAPHLAGVEVETGRKTFEYPTFARHGTQVYGRPSMTDLMIQDDRWQIAVEAKSTEYLRGPGETLADWLESHRGQADLDFCRVKARVWIEMILRAGCSQLGAPRSCKDVGYQFLHRTASACSGTDGRRPALVYQLFYKEGRQEHIAKMEAFKAQLRDWAKNLELKKLKFLILSVPMTNAEDVRVRYAGRKADLFDEMKTRTIYRFDFDGITVEEVL